MFQIVISATLTGLLFVASSCGTPRNEEVHDDPIRPEARMKPDGTGEGNAAAKASISQRFRTLDDYLAWLRMTQEPVDGSWYEEVRPGIYQLRTGNLRVLGPEGDATPSPQTFTRAELEKRFGFSK